jgi:hypothetical protein
MGAMRVALTDEDVPRSVVGPAGRNRIEWFRDGRSRPGRPGRAGLCHCGFRRRPTRSRDAAGRRFASCPRSAFGGSLTGLAQLHLAAAFEPTRCVPSRFQSLTSCASERKTRDTNGYGRSMCSPPELDIPRYPQVTERGWKRFTRLRSWVRVPQRPPCPPWSEHYRSDAACRRWRMRHEKDTRF